MAQSNLKEIKNENHIEKRIICSLSADFFDLHSHLINFNFCAAQTHTYIHILFGKHVLKRLSKREQMV